MSPSTCRSAAPVTHVTYYTNTLHGQPCSAAAQSRSVLAVLVLLASVVCERGLPPKQNHYMTLCCRGIGCTLAAVQPSQGDNFRIAIRGVGGHQAPEADSNGATPPPSTTCAERLACLLSYQALSKQVAQREWPSSSASGTQCSDCKPSTLHATMLTSNSRSCVPWPCAKRSPANLAAHEAGVQGELATPTTILLSWRPATCIAHALACNAHHGFRV